MNRVFMKTATSSGVVTTAPADQPRPAFHSLVVKLKQHDVRHFDDVARDGLTAPSLW